MQTVYAVTARAGRSPHCWSAPARRLLLLWLAAGLLTTPAIVVAQQSQGQPPGSVSNQSEPASAAPAAETQPAAQQQTQPQVEPPSEPVDEPPKRIIEHEPFDRITLNEANESAVLDVQPLDFPDRVVPQNQRPSSELRVRLVDKPEEEFAIQWRNIVLVELYEQMVLAEARRLVAAQSFDEAYEYFDFLLTNYPNTKGLEESLQNYLYLNAGHLFVTGQWPRAMAILEELQRRNPQYRHSGGQSALQALDLVADRILASYIERGNIASTRTLLRRLGNQYPSLGAVTKHREQLIALATGHRETARRLLEEGRLREGNEAMRKMRSVWPELEGGDELALAIAQQYPMLRVAVTQVAPEPDPASLDNWAARRTGRLTERLMMEFVGAGPEGGQYVFPYGNYEQSEDRSHLTLRLRSDSLPPATDSAYGLADYLLRLASPGDPSYRPAWASLVDDVQVQGVMDVVVNFRRPHVLPGAFLQVPLGEHQGDNVTTGPFVVGPELESGMRFLAAQDQDYRDGTGVAELIEQPIGDPLDALDALREGDVDLLDRVYPAYVATLQQDGDVTVRPYALPTLHMLVPNYQKLLPSNRTFRRALLYGIDRAAVLDGVVLQRTRLPGCRLISGPFPPGLSDNDPLSYAYDYRLEVRPYSPRLAKTLLYLAQHEVAETANKRSEEIPELSLLIGHPADPLARITCQAISEYLAGIGIPCTLRELPPGASRDATGQCDFVYAEAMVWEPVVDARQLLGLEGVAEITNPYVDLALRRLDMATSWTEVRQRLYDLHRIVYSEVAVIPLWQLSNYYAHRTGISGIGEQPPVMLYQNIGQWVVEPQVDESSP